MSDFMSNRSWLIVSLAMSVMVAMVGMATMPSAHGAAKSLTGLIDAVIARGPESRLPAHLSVVLGISRVEQQMAVKQAVIRDGQTVHTFNVCTAKHDDIVIMSVNEQNHTTKAYLVSATGALRKAVSYQAGAAATLRSTAEASADFANEMKFWTDIERRQAGSN